MIKRSGAEVSIEIDMDCGLQFITPRGVFGISPDMSRDLAKGYVVGSLQEFLDDEEF